MMKTASSMGDKPGETLMVFMVLNGGTHWGMMVSGDFCGTCHYFLGNVIAVREFKQQFIILLIVLVGKC